MTYGHDFLQWLGGSAPSRSLVDFAQILELTRTNELSVEGLHRSAALIGRHCPHVEAPHLSFAMRSEQFVAAFGVSAVAAAGAGLNDASIVSRFRLSGHPTLQAWLTAEVARLGENARVKLGMGSSYSLIRQVFYHCDLFSCSTRHRCIMLMDTSSA